ncbi:hypothetical protein [Bradyrhizobium sp. ORS 285]|uniref:hypothetical protein n=1 Tax=Bradyrhizobium sp. ORS 285 TaxID=115808 RepID=UPI001FCAE2C7|nr:hypothetical protein [Bradyrhizobium sp. ORS 285]
MAKMKVRKSPARRGKTRASDKTLPGSDIKSSANRVVAVETRVDAVMRAAEQSGLLKDKTGRIGGRVSSELVRQAKRQTGIEADTDLIEFALATIALEDNFATVFKETRGTVDPKLKLGF